MTDDAMRHAVAAHNYNMLQEDVKRMDERLKWDRQRDALRALLAEAREIVAAVALDLSDYETREAASAALARIDAALKGDGNGNR